MNDVEKLPPLQRTVRVPLDKQAAFDLFVRRLPEWWPLTTRSVHLADAASCHVEPHVGGRLFERSRAGEEAVWGRFTVFEDPERVVFTWHPGAPAQLATEVEVVFAQAGSTTLVVLEHRDWEKLGEKASFVRGIFAGGWNGVLARFEALAAGASELPGTEGPGCIGASARD